jgi:NitT/TauT family transport system substrate-binding protein
MVAVDAATKINMYAAGQGDCMFTTAPSILPKINKERPSRILLFSDVGLQLPSLGIVVTEQTLNKRREAVKAFVEETIRGWKYVIDGHWDEGVEAVVRLRPNLKINKESVRAVAEAYRPFFTTKHTQDKPFGWQSEDDWNATLAALTSVGLIKEGVKASNYYTNELVPSK